VELRLALRQPEVLEEDNGRESDAPAVSSQCSPAHLRYNGHGRDMCKKNAV
jgi:hypothetical protein